MHKVHAMRLTHIPVRVHADPVSDQIVLCSDQLRAAHVSTPDPDEFPTISVPHAARIAGVARRTGYAAAQRGEWPVIRTGRAVRVRTRQFLALCGFEES